MSYLPPGHPAVEAARRVHIARTGGSGVVWADVQAALEALDPIRQLHRELSESALDEDAEIEHGMRIVLNALEPLLNSPEELLDLDD